MRIPKHSTEDYLEVPQRHQDKDNLPSRYFVLRSKKVCIYLERFS